MLQRSAGSGRPPWIVRHACGLGAVAVGFAALIAAFVMQFGGGREITTVPNPWITVPLFLATAGVAAGAFVRREPLKALPIAGAAMAASALVLGWLVLVAAVALVAAIAILIISKLS